MKFRFDSDYWNEVWDAITKNKWRSFFTAMGVFWGIFILVVLSGFGNGLRQGVNTLVRDIATNSIFVIPSRTSIPYGGFASGRRWVMTDSDIEYIRQNIPGVKLVVGTIFAANGDQIVTHGDNSVSLGMVGQMPAYRQIEPIDLLWGRYINEQDMRDRRKVCVIGDQGYEALFERGENPIGQLIRVGSTYYTVVGVLRPVSDNVQMFTRPGLTVVVPYTTLQQALNQGEDTDLIGVVAHDDVDGAALQAEVEKALRTRHSVAPDDAKAIQAFNLAEQFGMFTNLLLGITILTWFVGLGTLLAGIVGISNIMLVVTKERTHEIGIRRAIGATPKVIRNQVVAESFLLTFIAGMIGIIISVGLLVLVDMVLSGNGPDAFFQSAQVDFPSVLVAAAAIVLGGIGAGILPANKALEVKAVDAIREE